MALGGAVRSLLNCAATADTRRASCAASAGPLPDTSAPDISDRARIAAWKAKYTLYLNISTLEIKMLEVLWNEH